MSHGSIFRFQTQASAITGVTAADFHHAALDADASARLAAMDRALVEDEDAKIESVEHAQKEFDQLNVEPSAADEITEPSADQEQIAAASPAPDAAPESLELESKSLGDAHNFPPQHELALHPEPPTPLETQSHLEDEMLAALTAQSEAARAGARPCSSEICEDDEIDLNDPLAILSQAIVPQPVNDLTAAPEVDLVQVESNEPVADIAAEDLQEGLPTEVIAELVEASIELAVEQAPEELVPEEARAATEVVGFSAAAEAASEMLVSHDAAPESSAPDVSGDDLSPIETALAETESALDADADLSAPVPLEVTPILDASGELQPGADDYTPPAPFQIHVPDALVVAATPTFASADDPAAVITSVSAAELSESFDLDSLCAPTAAEQLTAQTLDATIEQAIAQEEAVAEIKAVAEEFVTAQIEHDACVEAQAAAQSPAPCPPVVAPANQAAAPAGSPLASAAAALKADPASDRRKKRRALISSPIRVRSIDVTTSGPDEIATTVDVSRYGILFETVLDTYQRGMDVAVVFPYHKNATGQQAEQFGRVVRLHELPNGRHAVAIALGVGIGEHLVDASGRQLAKAPVQLSNSPAPVAKKLLVLVADADAMLRDTAKLYLQNEGYEVIAVSTANDAREVLNMFMPAMIVAEIEGDGDVLPGLDLCAHVKSSPSLRHVPVVLTSRSAYPSDYSNAHSMGAVVCMAKPYKLERLGHIVRLLAPLPEHLQAPCTQRPPDLSRGFGREAAALRNASGTSRNGNGTKKSNGNATSNLKSKFKFPTFR